MDRLVEALQDVWHELAIRPMHSDHLANGFRCVEPRAGEGGRLCLPPAAWPAQDRPCWAAATCPGDLLLDGGPTQARQESST